MPSGVVFQAFGGLTISKSCAIASKGMAMAAIESAQIGGGILFMARPCFGRATGGGVCRGCASDGTCLRSRLLISFLRRERDPKSGVVATNIGLQTGSTRGSQFFRKVVPRAATATTEFARAVDSCASVLRQRLVVAILDEFPCVADDVVQPEGVRPIVAHRRCERAAIAARDEARARVAFAQRKGNLFVQLRQRAQQSRVATIRIGATEFLIDTPKKDGGRAGAGRVLPFGFARQAIVTAGLASEPGGVVVGVLPGNTH